MIALLFAAAQIAALTGVRDSYPDLSPDGRTLAFHSNRSGRQAIWLASADGSNPRLLFDDAKAGTDPGTPDWSPDGRAVVFAMSPAGATLDSESDVYVINPDGSGLKRLTATPGDDSHPRWSADGKRIFFNSARATPDVRAPWGKQWIDIYSMAADGTDVRRHTDCREICTYPAPSPDGRFVAHRRITPTLGQNWDLSPGSRNSEVYVTPLAGGEPINVSTSPAYDGWPTWSPNGKWVLFTSNRDKLAYVGQIYAVRPDGSGLTPVTSGALSRAQPSFSADGRRLVFYQSLETDRFELGHIATLDVDLPD